ncbi:MAG: hypothetical protein H3C39_10705 [Flavobacteriia bacterium]|nr:hypothetical protein [Flavobacteriia bacterium]
MATELNDSQLEVLKLLNFLKNEKDVAEIKSLLRAYLADKVVRSADQAFDEKAYTNDVFNRWKQEHFRRNAQQ